MHIEQNQHDILSLTSCTQMRITNNHQTALKLLIPDSSDAERRRIALSWPRP